MPQDLVAHLAWNRLHLCKHSFRSFRTLGDKAYEQGVSFALPGEIKCSHARLIKRNASLESSLDSQDSLKEVFETEQKIVLLCTVLHECE